MTTATFTATGGPVWQDQGRDNFKQNGPRRSRRCVNTANPWDLTPPDMSREGLGMKPTPPVLGSAARPSQPHESDEPHRGCEHGHRSTTGRVPDLPNVLDAPNLAAAVPLEHAYYEAAYETVADLAEITCRGYLHPIASDEPIHIERALIDAFAQHGLRLFVRPEPPARKALTKAQRDAVYERDGRRCRWCGAIDGLVIDHIHPVRWGGTNDPSNLQVLCRGCNSWKSDRVAVGD